MTFRKSELKFREFDRYRGYYCGLCHAIGRRCSSTCRMALSYEMVFLSMLHSSLYEPTTDEEYHRCLIHPFRKQFVLCNEMINYAADLSALVSYYDLKDDWEDERRIPQFIGSLFLQNSAQRVGKQYPRQKLAIERYVARLHEVETCNDQNLDTAANLTGELLGDLYAIHEDVYAPDLRELGYYIGKFIYLCDCYEDIEHDRKKKNYNPLLTRSDKSTFESDCEQMLSDMMARACQAFERLPLIIDAEIMRNILYSGMWLRFEHTSEQRRKANKKR